MLKGDFMKKIFKLFFTFGLMVQNMQAIHYKVFIVRLPHAEPKLVFCDAHENFMSEIFPLTERWASVIPNPTTVAATQEACVQLAKLQVHDFQHLLRTCKEIGCPLFMELNEERLNKVGRATVLERHPNSLKNIAGFSIDNQVPQILFDPRNTLLNNVELILKNHATQVDMSTIAPYSKTDITRALEEIVRDTRRIKSMIKAQTIDHLADLIGKHMETVNRIFGLLMSFAPTQDNFHTVIMQSNMDQETSTGLLGHFTSMIGYYASLKLIEAFFDWQSKNKTPAIVYTGALHGEDLKQCMQELFPDAQIEEKATIQPMDLKKGVIHQWKPTLKRDAFMQMLNMHCSTCTKKEKLLRCSRCLRAYYCNASCQKLDWEKHKEICKRR